eukprot:COSAG01_NODE_2344_length_7864_cov_3.341790_8_plen_73_part_00
MQPCSRAAGWLQMAGDAMRRKSEVRLCLIMNDHELTCQISGMISGMVSGKLDLKKKQMKEKSKKSTRTVLEY